LPPSDAPATARRVRALSVSYAGEAMARDRLVPEEAAVELRVAGMPFAVMMLTPADLDDFARGFALTEGLAAPEEFRRARLEAVPTGLVLHLDLAPVAVGRALARRRALDGRTSCGVCGTGDLAQLARPPRHLSGSPLKPAAVAHALETLDGAQPLSRATRATHAAAFADPDGRFIAVREDVGRHNALDKLIGALLASGTAPAAGFVIVTSRASYEMVEKVAAFGCQTMVAISAPTALAIDRAAAHGMTLVGVARHDAMTVFSGAERVVAAPVEPATA
jgi:FdhD protein